MNSERRNLIDCNTIFAWIAVATCGLLCIPFAAMRLGNAVRWDVTDFTIMGVLIFGLASLFVLVARRVPRNYRLPLAAAFVLLFLYIWAELAVGIFTHLGS